mgnify:FL=1
MRLKDMTQILSTTQPIRIIYPNNESHIARLEEFITCEKYIVTDIYCKNGELNIKIAEPYGDSFLSLDENIKEIMTNVLEDLIEKHTNQIAKMISEDSDVKWECFEDIFTYMGISTEVLDKYKY